MAENRIRAFGTVGGISQNVTGLDVGVGVSSAGITAGAVVAVTNYATETTIAPNTSYQYASTKIKVNVSGTYRFAFDAKKESFDGGKLSYISLFTDAGAAFGEEVTRDTASYSTTTQDLFVSAGTTIKIGAKTEAGSTYGTSIRNVKIMHAAVAESV